MATCYMKLRVVLLIITSIGLLLYIVGFAIPKWSTHKDGSKGLWQICYINAGAETCAVWPSHLKSSSLETAQALACLGLSFYIIFVLTGALTIFWTSHWKTARAIKYATVVFAVLAVIFVAASLAIYKTDKGAGENTVAYAWYLAIIATVVAGVAAPFYLVDACRTVQPKKPDKEQFFKNINVSPKLTFHTPEQKDRDTLKLDNIGRPPLLSQLGRQHTTFVHPPPKQANKKLTQKDINEFPLPPTKTKLNLYDQEEKENHPAPKVVLPTDTRKEDRTSTKSSSIISISDDFEEENIIEHSIFKFHKSNTDQKGGKTIPKFQNEREKPVMMVMPSIAENDDENVDERKPSRMMKQSQRNEEPKIKFISPYFVKEKVPENEKLENTVNKAMNNFKLLKKNQQNSKAVNDRLNEMLNVYTGGKRQIKKNSGVEICFGTYREDLFHRQDGLTIYDMDQYSLPINDRYEI